MQRRTHGGRQVGLDVVPLPGHLTLFQYYFYLFHVYSSPLKLIKAILKAESAAGSIGISGMEISPLLIKV
jgi:hypothetical protein